MRNPWYTIMFSGGPWALNYPACTSINLSPVSPQTKMARSHIIAGPAEQINAFIISVCFGPVESY